MDRSQVKIHLDLDLRINHIMPKISMGIDDHRIDLPSPMDVLMPLTVEDDLAPGSHKIWIRMDDQDLFAQDPHMALIIKSVRFQCLSDEFSVYSCYAPQYPDHWIVENLAQGKQLPTVIHSNYLGWPGLWWVDFQTPIYAWLHQKLNLGWLV